MNNKKIGERIKAVRKSKRLTQEEFGQEIGVKGNTITGYERGTRTPSDAVINNLCRTFRVNQTWLRTGDGEMDLTEPDFDDVLGKLCSEYNCNPLEMKFLSGYFLLSEQERDAFCALISKMFPAVTGLAGPNPLKRPLKFEEAEPLDDVTALLQKQPTEMTEDEIDAVAAEMRREMIEEKEAGGSVSHSSESSGSTGKMA